MNDYCESRLKAFTNNLGFTAEVHDRLLHETHTKEDVRIAKAALAKLRAMTGVQRVEALMAEGLHPSHSAAEAIISGIIKDLEFTMYFVEAMKK